MDRVDAKLLWVSARPGLVWSGRRLGLFLLVAAAFLSPKGPAGCWIALLLQVAMPGAKEFGAGLGGGGVGE